MMKAKTTVEAKKEASLKGDLLKNAYPFNPLDSVSFDCSIPTPHHSRVGQMAHFLALALP